MSEFTKAQLATVRGKSRITSLVADELKLYPRLVRLGVEGSSEPIVVPVDPAILTIRPFSRGAEMLFAILHHPHLPRLFGEGVRRSRVSMARW